MKWPIHLLALLRFCYGITAENFLILIGVIEILLVALTLGATDIADTLPGEVIL